MCDYKMNKNCKTKTFYYAIYPNIIVTTFKDVSKYNGSFVVKAKTIKAKNLEEAKKIINTFYSCKKISILEYDPGKEILQIGDSIDEKGQLKNVLAEKRSEMWIHKK